MRGKTWLIRTGEQQVAAPGGCCETGTAAHAHRPRTPAARRAPPLLATAAPPGGTFAAGGQGTPFLGAAPLDKASKNGENNVELSCCFQYNEEVNATRLAANGQHTFKAATTKSCWVFLHSQGKHQWPEP